MKKRAFIYRDEKMDKLKYIVVEGIHGSGKSSVAKEITKILQER
ncbi:MAG: hypothetical protein WCL18_06720 [bacterium]